MKRQIYFKFHVKRLDRLNCQNVPFNLEEPTDGVKIMSDGYRVKCDTSQLVFCWFCYQMFTIACSGRPWYWLDGRHNGQGRRPRAFMPARSSIPRSYNYKQPLTYL